jgi:hypothetical protein
MSNRAKIQYSSKLNMELNKKYSLNDGKGHIIFSEGNSGTINAEYEIKGNKSKGTFNGTLENNCLKGTFFVDGVAGLMEFTFSEIGFQAKWKKGIEPGPMRGEWKGTLNIDTQTTSPVKPQEKVEKLDELPKNEDQPKKNEEKERIVKNEVKQSKNKYTPLTTTKTWQPFLKEVSEKLHQPIRFKKHALYWHTFDDKDFYFEINGTYGNDSKNQKESVIEEQNRNFFGLLNWIEFLIKEEYLLIEPIEETLTELEILKIIKFDQYKKDKLYLGSTSISVLHPDLIASRKYYPVLLYQYLSRILKRDKIVFDWALIYIIKNCEPEVYKEFSLAFSELSYEEKALERYVFNEVSIDTLSGIYKDFLPTLLAFKSKITYTYDDISKYPEFEFWKDYAYKYLKNELKFSDYLKTYFYGFNERDYRIFDAIFKFIKKRKENFSFHLQNYTYANLTDSTDKELLKRHISLLEFLLESGKSELADELYMEKMEFEKKFPN